MRSGAGEPDFGWSGLEFWEPGFSRLMAPLSGWPGFTVETNSGPDLLVEAFAGAYVGVEPGLAPVPAENVTADSRPATAAADAGGRGVTSATIFVCASAEGRECAITGEMSWAITPDRVSGACKAFEPAVLAPELPPPVLTLFALFAFVATCSSVFAWTASATIFFGAGAVGRRGAMTGKGAIGRKTAPASLPGAVWVPFDPAGVPLPLFPPLVASGVSGSSVFG